MRLRIEAPNKAPYWFVGSPNVNVREFAEAMDLAVTVQRQQQQVAGAGQDTASFLDRGNQRVTIQATTTRTFASAIARMDFLAQLAPADAADRVHEWQGDVWLREEDGANFAEWLLEDAVVSLAAVDPIGAVGLRLRYAIQAGGFGDKQQSVVSDLLFRLNLARASLDVTSAQLASEATTAGLTDGDWLDVVLQWPEGAGVSHRFSVGSGGDLALPFSDTTLVLIKSTMDVVLSAPGLNLDDDCVQIIDNDPDPDTLRVQTLSNADPELDGRGDGGTVSVAIGRGTSTFFSWSATGSEDREAINVLPDNEDLTINTAV